jgi:hypothetical protein
MTMKAFTERETIFKGTAVTSRRERSHSAIASNREPHAPRRVPWFIPADQVYYWSSQWQRGEAESLANLNAGRSKTFDNPTDAVRYLLDD